MKIFTLNGVGEYRNTSTKSNIDDLELAPIYMTFERAALELQYEPKLFKQFLTEIGFIRKSEIIEPEHTSVINNYAVMEQIFIGEERIHQMMITEEGIQYLIQTIKSIFKTS